MDSREANRNLHPPACTCVDCVNKRLKRLGMLPRNTQRYRQHSSRKYHPKYHAPTSRSVAIGKQTRIKRNYPRHIRIISNIILSLIVIFVIGLLGGGIYGIAKYHNEVWVWLSHQTHSIIENTGDFIGNVPEFFSDSKDKVLDSEIAKTITGIEGEVKQSIDAQQKTEEENRIRQEKAKEMVIIAERLAFNLINNERVILGLSPTTWDDSLYQLSLAHTQEMANRKELFHSDTNASIGENAWGGYGYSQKTGEELANAIVDGWMSSPLHKAWLLHAPIQHSVVSIVSNTNGQYASWTFWGNETAGGPPLIQRAYDLWQLETGGSIPWLTWLHDIKGYPYNQEFLKQLGLK